MKQGWEIKAFDDCIERVKVKTKLPSSSYQKEGAFPIVSQEKELISGYWDEYDDVVIHATPITIFGDHTMVVKYVDFDFVVGADGVKILLPKPFLNPKFFYYWVKSIEIPSRGYARHYRYLREQDVVIPSLAEQERIVEVLDREFEKIDAMKANAEQNLQHAKDLFQAALRQELQPKEGWETAPMNKIYDVRDGTHDSPRYHTTGYPLITSKNLCEDFIDMDNVKYISKEDYDKINERSKVDVGDVLFAMIGTIGNPTLVVKEPHFAIKNMALFKVPNNQSGSLLRYILSIDIVLGEMRKKAKGSNQPFVSLGFLRGFEISIPATREQQDEIVARLDILSERCKALEENYKKTIALCDDMKQVLLRKAFNGEL